MHERLVTNVNRQRNGMRRDSLCPLCKKDNETIIHVLKDCRIAKDIWIALGVPGYGFRFFLVWLQGLVGG